MLKKTRMRHRNNRQHAFTLAETLLAVIIFGIVLIVLTNVFADFVNLYIFDDEQVLARQRGTDAIKLLEIPVLHMGLGIPSNVTNRATIFQDTFSSSSAPFKNWGAPINISGTKRDNLRILYALESGIFQLDEDKDAFYSSSQAGLKLTGRLDANKVVQNKPSSTHSWVTFPGQSLPAYVKSGLSTSTPQIEAYRNSIQGTEYNERLRAFSEVLYIRAIRAWVDSNHVFHVMDVKESEAPGTGEDMTIPGVLRVQFYTDSRILSVDLLTRGNTRDAMRVGILKSSRPNLISRWSLTDAEMEYLLDEVSMQWRIRNYEYIN